MPSLQQLSLICPACSTRLRLSPTNLPESAFDCPDCSTSLQLEKSESGDLRVQALDVIEAPAAGGSISRNQAFAIAATSIVAVTVLILGLSGDTDEAAGGANDESPAIAAADETVESPQLQPVDPDAGSLTEPTPDIDVPPVEPGDAIAQRAPADDPALRIPADDNGEPAVPANAELVPPAAAGDSDDTPILPELDPGEPVVATPVQPAFETRVGIAIPSFDQTKPTSLASVIEIVEQLAQVSIDTAAVPVELQRKSVSFAVTDTTPLGILSEAARLAGLQVVVDDEAIRLLPDADK